MGIVLNSNSVATAAGYNMNRTYEELEKSLARLSSGKRIVSPSDDAGGLAVSYKIESALSRSEATANNLKNGISYLQVQDGAMKVISSVLDRMAELRSFYNDISKNDQDRANYNYEFQELQEQLQVITKEKFNGVSLFSTDEPDSNPFMLTTTEDGKTGVVSINRVGLFENLNNENMFDGSGSYSDAAQRPDAVKTFSSSASFAKGDYIGGGGKFYVVTQAIVSVGAFQNIDSAISAGRLTDIGTSHPRAKYYLTSTAYTKGDVIYDSNDKKYYVASSDFTSSSATAALHAASISDNLRLMSYNSNYESTTYPALHKAKEFVNGASISKGDVVEYNNKLFVATTSISAATNTSSVNPAATQNLSRIVRSGNTATVTSAVAHGYSTNDVITIGGASNAPYNGSKTITVTGTNTFTYTIDSTADAEATGNLTVSKVDSRFAELSSYTIGKSLVDKTYGISDFTIEDFVGFIQTLANTRAQNGGEMSRLNHSQLMLEENIINLEAANGRIIDADMARESTRFARLNVLVQAGAAMVAQANSLSQISLSLLG